MTRIQYAFILFIVAFQISAQKTNTFSPNKYDKVSVSKEGSSVDLWFKKGESEELKSQNVNAVKEALIYLNKEYPADSSVNFSLVLDNINNSTDKLYQVEPPVDFNDRKKSQDYKKKLSYTLAQAWKRNQFFKASSIVTFQELIDQQLSEIVYEHLEENELLGQKKKNIPYLYLMIAGVLALLIYSIMYYRRQKS